MTGTSNLKVPALVFALLFLASRGLFAAASAFDGMEGCGCLAHGAAVLAWPAFAIGLGGLFVTATRAAARKLGSDCPIGPGFMLMIPAAWIGWATVCATHDLGGEMLVVARGVDLGALVLAWITSMSLIASIRRDRRRGGLPVARTLD